MKSLSMALICAGEAASRLREGLGLHPLGAAQVAARRWGVPIRSVLVICAPALARAWLLGSRLRPTSRPVRALNAPGKEDT
jgi:hypothetical protein